MVIIFRALWVKRGSISRWMILWRFSCLYVAISVIIKDLYARSQVLFCISRPPSATFPHHSLKTVAHFLRLRQYICEKDSYKYIYWAWENGWSHYLHSALLWRKELHCWGSWLSLDMDSKVERICLNIGLSWINIQTFDSNESIHMLSICMLL